MIGKANIFKVALNFVLSLNFLILNGDYSLASCSRVFEGDFIYPVWIGQETSESYLAAISEIETTWLLGEGENGTVFRVLNPEAETNIYKLYLNTTEQENDLAAFRFLASQSNNDGIFQGFKVLQEVALVQTRWIRYEDIRGVPLDQFLKMPDISQEAKDFYSSAYMDSLKNVKSYFDLNALQLLILDEYMLPGSPLPNLNIQIRNDNIGDTRLRFLLKPNNVLVTHDGLVWIDPH